MAYLLNNYLFSSEDFYRHANLSDLLIRGFYLNSKQVLALYTSLSEVTFKRD